MIYETQTLDKQKQKSTNSSLRIWSFNIVNEKRKHYKSKQILEKQEKKLKLKREKRSSGLNFVDSVCSGVKASSACFK